MRLNIYIFVPCLGNTYHHRQQQGDILAAQDDCYKKFGIGEL
jgi:hypothetical protein